MVSDFDEFIFSPSIHFTEKALALFHYQYANNPVYKRFVEAINCKVELVQSIEQIPFLPISLFKTHTIATTEFTPVTVFESSGTTGSINSQHSIKDLSLYEKSFINCFEQFYGSIKNYCILGLLPSYLERGHSSLVYMVKRMIETGNHPLSGFYLYDHKALAEKIIQLEKEGQPAMLIGVTYALLDFAEQFPIPLKNTRVMETGGMKGRKKELLRSEVHDRLQQAFGIEAVHSEYGMTELLSQAYAQSKGLFYAPPWMKLCIREEDDPFSIKVSTDSMVTGAINIIDLANVYSCCFIATDDLGRLHANGSFEVLGRMDDSDVRGCSLLITG